jgi:hypothetical protein
MHVGFAIGYHEKRPFLEKGMNLLFKPGWCPDGFGGMS